MTSARAFIIVGVFAVCNGLPLESASGDIGQFFSSTRIVGGSDAPEGFAPHMAALVVGNHYISLVCGGSIVAANMILTAAHCIDIFVVWGELLSTFHGVVGTNNWNMPGIVVQFKHYHLHSKWDWGTIKNDIGFLVLDKPLTWNKHVAAMALNMDRIEREEPCYVTGWGQLGSWPNNIIPYILQLLYVKTITHLSCVKGVEAASNHIGSVPHVDAEIEICTFHSIGHGMCNGDSGSALVSTKTKSQIGIVSWGFPCAIGGPDVFVRISGFKTYIQETMAQYR